jgi:hypothetical protein
MVRPGNAYVDDVLTRNRSVKRQMDSSPVTRRCSNAAHLTASAPDTGRVKETRKDHPGAKFSELTGTLQVLVKNPPMRAAHHENKAISCARLSR